MSENTQDPQFEISFYEGILKKQPDFVQALIALGDLYTKVGEIQKGYEVDVRLTALQPEDPYVFYNLACSQSLLQNVEGAFKTIRKAVYLSYSDWAFMDDDPDLENLRKYPPYQEYLLSIIKEID